MKETERVDSELVCLKRKNENLNESFKDVIEQRDTEQSEVYSLNEKLKMVQSERNKLSDALKGETSAWEPKKKTPTRFDEGENSEIKFHSFDRSQ